MMSQVYVRTLSKAEVSNVKIDSRMPVHIVIQPDGEFREWVLEMNVPSAIALVREILKRIRLRWPERDAF